MGPDKGSVDPAVLDYQAMVKETVPKIMTREQVNDETVHALRQARDALLSFGAPLPDALHAADAATSAA